MRRLQSNIWVKLAAWLLLTALTFLSALMACKALLAIPYSSSSGGAEWQENGAFQYLCQKWSNSVATAVADQIALFDPAIGRQQVRQAAEQVGLHAAIEALEQGYDTPAREDLFSQGQLQLLSIARAIAADPPILLLDEMTANLDGQTEAAVLAALEQAAAHRTVLSISHRLYQGLGGRQIPIGGGCR